MARTSKKPVLLVKNKWRVRPYQMTAAVLVLAVAGSLWVFGSHAASGMLSLTPSSSTVGLGNTFTVAVHENSGSDPVNAVEADLTYPSSQLQFVSSDASGSAFSVEAVNTGGSGTVTLGRGAAGGTSVTGDQVVAVLTFKALTSGAANIAFAGSSALVRSSDQTNVLVTTTPGSYTVADQTAPTVPAGLARTSATVSSVVMSWTASTDNVGVTGYKIFRNGTQVGTSTTTTFTNTGLTAGTSYNFTVAANDAAGNTSAQSTAVAMSTLPDTLAPSVPSTPTSPSQTMSSINLAWTAATDDVGVTGYRVYRNGTLVTSVATTSFSDTGLTPNTSYSYTVAAFDGAGNASAQSTAASIKTLPDTQAPTVPAGLNLSQGRQAVTLTWNAATDNVGVAMYVIYRGGTQIATTAFLTYTDSSLAVGDYTYSVAARDGSGNTSAQTAGVQIHVYTSADTNHDGHVNVFDLSALLSNWNKTGTNTNDLNGDGTVNVFDLSILLSGWTG